MVVTMAYQVAFATPEKEAAHVVEFTALGHPEHRITVCGVYVVSFGSMLPAATGRWPAQDMPWCPRCLSVVFSL